MTAPSQPPLDISRRALSIARMIDRRQYQVDRVTLQHDFDNIRRREWRVLGDDFANLNM